MEPRYSILIPAYKSMFLEKAIRSCLNQSYREFELIVVDDASPENLQIIVSKFADKRIHYYRNEKNCGSVDVVDNWNICLNYSNGTFVICMGDDDMLGPNSLEEYNKLIEKYPDVNLYHSRVIAIDEHDKPIDILPERNELENRYAYMLERLHSRVQYIGDFCFRSEFLKRAGGFYKQPLAWASDDISTYICANNGVANTNVPTFMYRRSSITISSTGNTETKLKAIIKEGEWYKDFINKTTPLDYVERLLLNNIIKEIPNCLMRRKAGAIGQDIKKHPLHIIKWFFKKNKYAYGNTCLIHAIKNAITRG